MTDAEAVRVLAALADEPYPWAQPGVRFRRVVRHRGRKPVVLTGVVAERAAGQVYLRYAGAAETPAGAYTLDQFRVWEARHGDVFEEEDQP